MSDRDHACLIFEMAKKDLSALEGMLNKQNFADEIFGFHAQQAIEKCLKAWIALLGSNYGSLKF
jgi:HEPN domain-containing protein